MDIISLFTFFAFIFTVTAASPVFSLATPARYLSLTKLFFRDVIPPHPICADGEHNVTFDHGDQHHQDEIISDCANLSDHFQQISNETGNFNTSCTPASHPFMIASHGRCSLYIDCLTNNTNGDNEEISADGVVAFINETIFRFSWNWPGDNTSILAAHDTFDCNSHHMYWTLAFNISESG